MKWFAKRWTEPSTRWGLLALGGIVGAVFGVPPEATEEILVQVGGAVATVATVIQVLREEKE